MVRIYPVTEPGLNDRYFSDRIYGIALNMPRYRSGIAGSVMPTAGDISFDPARSSSWYDHDLEELHPWSHRVWLEDFGIWAEWTTAERTAFTNSTSRMQGGRRTCFSGSLPKARSMSAVTGSFRAGKRSIMPANISMPSPTGLSIAPARVAGSGFPRRDRRRAAMSAPGSLPRQGSVRCASG